MNESERPSVLTFRVLWACCALLLVAGAVSAATYNDGDVELEQAGSTADELTTSDATTTTPPAVGDDDDPETPDTDAPVDTAADARTAETTATAPQTSPGDTVATTAPAEARPLQSPTAAGTYVYDITGTADGDDVSGTAELVVGQVDANGRQTQVLTSDEGETTTVYRYATEGMYLESLQLTSDQGSFKLVAKSPFLIVPANVEAGTTTTGVLQGDGLTADVTFTVVDIGPDLSRARLDADLEGKVSGIDVEGTMQSTIVGRTTDLLPVESHDKTDIVVGNGLTRMKSDTHSKLRQ